MNIVCSIRLLVFVALVATYPAKSVFANCTSPAAVAGSQTWNGSAMVICDGTNWNSIQTGGGGIPSGAVMAFDLGSCPTGWSLLDGSGGRPDARGRTLIGAGTGPGLTARALGATGGEESHTLTVAEIPSLSVTIPIGTGMGDINMPVAGNNYLAGSQVNDPNEQYTLTGPYTTTAVSGSNLVGTTNGSGGAHNIMQPFLSLLYCRKD